MAWRKGYVIGIFRFQAASTIIRAFVVRVWVCLAV